MDYRQIKELLDKYLEGETSLQEERQLRAYFKDNKAVPVPFKYAQVMFSRFDLARQVEMPTKKRKRRRMRKIIAAVASVVVVFGLGIGFVMQERQTKRIYCYINHQPITDEAVAMNELRKAFQMVSVPLQRGKDEIKQIARIDEIKNRITNKK